MCRMFFLEKYGLCLSVFLSVSLDVQTDTEQGKNNTRAQSYTALCVVWSLRPLSSWLLLHYTLTCNCPVTVCVCVCFFLTDWKVLYAQINLHVSRTQSCFKTVQFQKCMRVCVSGFFFVSFFYNFLNKCDKSKGFIWFHWYRTMTMIKLSCLKPSLPYCSLLEKLSDSSVCFWKMGCVSTICSTQCRSSLIVICIIHGVHMFLVNPIC